MIATRIRFMCPMNFNKFPMDTQTCKFQVSKKTFMRKLYAKFRKIWYTDIQQITIKFIPNSLLRLGHSIMTTLRWSTGHTIFPWCPTLPRVSWITRWRLPVSRWRTPSTFQQRPATTVWQVLRWFSTGGTRLTAREIVSECLIGVWIAGRLLTTWSLTTCPAHCLLLLAGLHFSFLRTTFRQFFI